MVAANIPWDELVRRIDKQLLTPFLGAGISRPPLPAGSELATRLGKRWEFPFVNDDDLIQVTQYRATMIDPLSPKGAVADLFKKIADPDFGDESQPHSVLASLPLPVYLTTNYDDYMEKALQRAGRQPVVEICRWNSALRGMSSYLAEHEPTIDNPVVFHLHGHIDNPDSFVLTEDDYLDFIVNARRYEGTTDPAAHILPPKVHELISSTSLLFIGYGLRDWNLRVLLRTLVQNADISARRTSISVQLEPGELAESATEAEAAKRRADAIQFLVKYFQDLQITLFWGTADSFLGTLKSRWDGRGDE